MNMAFVRSLVMCWIYKVGLHTIYDAVRQLALQEGVVVTGSELVGLIPLEALLSAGVIILRRQGKSRYSPQRFVASAIRSLGLGDLKPFEPSQSIIEYQIASDGPLVRQTCVSLRTCCRVTLRLRGGSIGSLWCTSQWFGGNGWTVVDKDFCKILVAMLNQDRVNGQV